MLIRSTIINGAHFVLRRQTPVLVKCYKNKSVFPFRTILTGSSSLKNLEGQNKDIVSLGGIEKEKKNEGEFYDIVVVGGGLVGTTLAVSLGSSKWLSGKRILLLESADRFWTKPPSENPARAEDNNPNFSNRVVALSPGSKGLLNRLGIWQNVWRFQTVSSLEVWDALSDARITFQNPTSTSPVSYIVENPTLSWAVCQALDSVKNVKVEFRSRVKSCSLPSSGNDKDKAEVTLDNDRIIKTDLLIGADGFNSKVRGSISSPAIAFNYDKTAVVATLKLTNTEPDGENHIAWQRFVPSGGPIALLPLAPNFSSLVWSTTPQYAKELQEMEPEHFVDAVNSAFWKEHSRSELVKISCGMLETLKLGDKSKAKLLPPSVIEVVDKSRASFPLGFGHSAYYASKRAVLIGDAAHRVHPLAGQGLNLGLGDIDVLEQVLSEAVGYGADIGSYDILREYESQRQRHNLTIQSGIDILHRLYSENASPIVALRSIGLSIVNSSSMLKNLIMSRAST